MTDQTEEQTAAAASASGEQEPPSIEETTKKLETVSFSIWPPTQRTRDAVIKRLIESLSGKSVLSDRYGQIPITEAEVISRRIEEESFTAAGGSSPPAAGDDGIEILQVYSKEISKRMLDTAKARSGNVTSSVNEESDNDGASAVVTKDEESEA
uniref:MFP1 attachment factor 1-like n=1 Tax=Erigeron canadensis TaxID=72917 RepID=UPI001CB9C7E8|nr:MFP1 attachment factor 1-like [Erigeron canadensis]